MTVVRRRVATSPKDSVKGTSRHKVMLFNGEATVSNVNGKWTQWPPCWVQICKTAKATIPRANSMATITIRSHPRTKPTTDRAAFTGQASSCTSSRAWDHINCRRPTVNCRAGTIRPFRPKATFPSLPVFTSSNPSAINRAASCDPHQRIPACETWCISRAGICQQSLVVENKHKADNGAQGFRSRASTFSELCQSSIDAGQCVLSGNRFEGFRWNCCLRLAIVQETWTQGWALLSSAQPIVIRFLLKIERTFRIGLQFAADVNAIKFLTSRVAFIKSNLVAN